MIYIFIWFILVISNALVHAYLYPKYFDLKPVEKVKRGYLTFCENTKYLQSVWYFRDDFDLRLGVKIHYRFDILLKGLYRSLFHPLDFKEELKKLNSHISDVNAINPHKFYEAKKTGKLFI